MSRTDFYVYLLSLRLRGILAYLHEFSGVTCFTEHCDHPLLWSHYADAHAGVCLVFNNLDGACPLFEHLLPVIYTDAVPSVRLLDYYMDRQALISAMFTLLHTKQSAWSYEREWRIVFPSTRPLSDEERSIRFRERDLCKIILGDRISPAARDALREKGVGRDFPVLVYQARVPSGGLTAPSHLVYKYLPWSADYPDHSAWNKLPGPELGSPFPFATPAGA